MIALELYLITGMVLFSLGLMIVLIKKNAIVVLMGVELMLNAGNLNLVAFAQLDNDFGGTVFALFVIVIAVAEAAVGLSIIIRVYRHYRTPVLDEINELKN